MDSSQPKIIMWKTLRETNERLDHLDGPEIPSAISSLWPHEVTEGTTRPLWLPSMFPVSGRVKEHRCTRECEE